MNEHYLSRVNNQSIGIGNGGDDLVIYEADYENFVYLIFDKITENYKIKLSGLSQSEIIDFSIYLLGSMDKEFCEFVEKENKLIFIMKQDGYRYQFNGYMSSEEKRNSQNAKLTKKANFFIGMTLIYYIVTFIIKDLDYDINKNIETIISLIKIYKNDFSIIIGKIIITFILNVVLIKSIANYLENKIDNI